MMCRDPFIRGRAAFPCGRCDPCLFNRKRLWTHRIMLESLCHADNAFVTLTYNDESLPLVSGVEGSLSTLRYADVQKFWKRLRKKIEPLKIRYYVAGEYGEAPGYRPHYHAILFGFPSCRQTQTQYRSGFLRCCPQCQLVSEAWGLGHVYLGTVETSSAQYVCGYVTKKMTRRDNAWLRGRDPEFGKPSLDPGLGAHAMWEFASELMRLGLDTALADVPSAMRHGGRAFPIGRYLRMKLRKYVGKSEKAPQETLDEIAKALLPLFEASRGAPTSEGRAIAFKNAVVDADEQKVRSLLARAKIFKQRRSL